MTHVLEIVEFKLNTNTTAEAFLQEVQKTTSFVTGLEGFVERHTAKQDDDLWVDVVEWQSMDHAKAASEAFVQSTETQGMMALINPSTVAMKHFSVRNTM